MVGISISEKQNENAKKDHEFERIMEGACWCQNLLTEGETERSVRNLGTASVNVIETGDDEGSMTDLAKEAVDNSIDTAVFRVQALKCKCM
jgi:hypothetical protein